MLATGSSRTERLLFVAWVAGAAINVVLMYVLPGGETVPFHVVWVGLSVVYGFVTLRRFAVLVVLAAVALTTGYVLIHHAADGTIGWEETTEVPLMAAVFGAMVWHVHRRNVAVLRADRLADRARLRADTQRLLVGFVSHELRTPITVARGHAELIRGAAGRSATIDPATIDPASIDPATIDPATIDPAIMDDATIVLEELDKLTRITQRLVTLMQMDRDHHWQRADADAELARVVWRWQPTARRQWTIDSAIGAVMIDRERLETALDCLLENAVHFTRDGDRIAVTGRRAADGWIVEVTDSGAGMTAEEVSALNTNTYPIRRTASGSGLGLRIVRAAVGAAGGRVCLSAEPGAGTTVTLHFPGDAADAALGAPELDGAIGPDGWHMRDDKSMTAP